MKKVAILQSNYIPWKGYFDLIATVDEFILYDDVQYTKNDWRNRNKIITPNGIRWLTVPVKHSKLSQKIKHTKEQNFSVLNHHIWSVSDIHCKYMMIREGIGWGTLPQKMVQKDIEDGILCVVEPQSWKDLSLNIPMVALYHKGSILSHYAQDFITECMNVLAPT